MNTKVVLYLCIALVLVQCNTTELKPLRPSGLTFTEVPKPISTLAIPVTINMQDVNAAVNAQLGDALYTDGSFDDNNKDNLKLSVTKRNAIAVAAVGNGIQITAPLHLEGAYRVSKQLFGKTISYEQPLSLNITAVVNTVPSITRDWNLQTSSKATISWDDLPVIEFAGTKLDLPSLFAKSLERQTTKLATMMDAEIPKQLKLRETLLKMLPQLTMPYQVDRQTNSWFVLRPKAFYITPFAVVNGNLQFAVGLASVMEINVNQQPVAETFSGTTLPPMVNVPRLNNKIELLIHPEIQFALMDSLLHQMLQDPRFNKIETKDYSFDILDAIVFPVNNAVSIGLNIKGWARYGRKIKKIKGLVYVEGRPSFDAQKQQLVIENFDFNVKTKDVLVKSASWLLNAGPMMRKIERALVFPLGKEIAQAKAQANQVMNKRYGNIAQLNGTITDITFNSAVITETALRMPIAIQGTVAVTLDGFAGK